MTKKMGGFNSRDLWPSDEINTLVLHRPIINVQALFSHWWTASSKMYFDRRLGLLLFTGKLVFLVILDWKGWETWDPVLPPPPYAITGIANPGTNDCFSNAMAQCLWSNRPIMRDFIRLVLAVQYNRKWLEEIAAHGGDFHAETHHLADQMKLFSINFLVAGSFPGVVSGDFVYRAVRNVRTVLDSINMRITGSTASEDMAEYYQLFVDAMITVQHVLPANSRLERLSMLTKRLNAMPLPIHSMDPMTPFIFNQTTYLREFEPTHIPDALVVHFATDADYTFTFDPANLENYLLITTFDSARYRLVALALHSPGHYTSVVIRSNVPFDADDALVKQLPPELKIWELAKSRDVAMAPNASVNQLLILFAPRVAMAFFEKIPE